MDIKSRIDGLSETDAKAALFVMIQQDAYINKGMHEFSAGFGASILPIEIWQNRSLENALKEARK
jgi:hypothetical protein